MLQPLMENPIDKWSPGSVYLYFSFYNYFSIPLSKLSICSAPGVVLNFDKYDLISRHANMPCFTLERSGTM